MGQRLADTGQLTLIGELVGYAIERKIFETMDPASSIGDTGQTVQNWLDAIAQRRAAIKETVPRVDALMPTLAETDLATEIAKSPENAATYAQRFGCQADGSGAAIGDPIATSPLVWNLGDIAAGTPVVVQYDVLAPRA